MRSTSCAPSRPYVWQSGRAERSKCRIIAAAQKLNHARNWDEFRDALRDWDVPPQNMIYADKEGYIGYIMAGAIPIRAKGQAVLPSLGWTGECEWAGYIPFEELPQTYNPQQQFIVTANNRVVNDLRKTLTKMHKNSMLDTRGTCVLARGTSGGSSNTHHQGAP